MAKKRVVITGMGSVNPLGLNVKQTLEAMKEGRCAIKPLSHIRDLDRLTIKIGAQISGFDVDGHFNRQELSLYDRFTQISLVAMDEAVKQSGLVFSESLAQKTGVIFGTAGGGLQTTDENYHSVYALGKNRVHPFVVPRLMPSAAASHASIKYGLGGPVFSVSSACASSNHAMAQSFQMVRSGMNPVMITGGADTMLSFGGIKAWEGLRVLSEDGCRPFCASRNGMVQGEGAGVFVFEEYEHAQARGAEILCEVAGASMSSDAHDIVSPSKTGAVRALTGALQDAEITADQVGYINAHGTATQANDETESAAISQVFGEDCARMPVSSTKSMHGHLMGGAGAVELLSCIMALREGVIAPTVSFRKHDPNCALDVVPNQAREAQINVALSNAFAFGGLNAVLALRKI